MANFSDLLGKTLAEIHVGVDGYKHQNDFILFVTTDGKRYKMCHKQDCCESVYIDDICGIPIQDLVGDPILVAEARISDQDRLHKLDEAWEWTFYELATIKGAVTIKWYGSSNGYYSVSVGFYEAEMEG